jgi:hypothetical protein
MQKDLIPYLLLHLGGFPPNLCEIQGNLRFTLRSPKNHPSMFPSLRNCHSEIWVILTARPEK